MLEQEKLNRDQLLQDLEISEDTLSLYEQELGMNTDLASSGVENFTGEDLESIKTFHRLRESGLTYNEINLLTSFSDVLGKVDLQVGDEVKKLQKLSPIYRLKQSLNLARQELNLLKEKSQELEQLLKKETEARTSGIPGSTLLQVELDAKQKTINNLDRKLAEVLSQKGHVPIKGKKAKELYQALTEKDLELVESKKKNEELTAELTKTKEETNEFKERLELMEDEISEMELEVEERYQEQITELKDRIEELINKKQSEWETYFVQTSDQHRKELLTLQRRHEQEILRLKGKIKEKIDEIEEIKASRNPLIGLFRMRSSRN